MICKSLYVFSVFHASHSLVYPSGLCCAQHCDPLVYDSNIHVSLFLAIFVILGGRGVSYSSGWL